MRRLTFALVLLVSLLAVTAATAAAPTRILRVAEVKLSFAVPKSWVSLNPRDVVTAAGRELRRENPELGAILDQLARPGSPVRLVVFDPATAGGFLTNVNVVVSPIPSGVSFETYLQATRAELARVPGLIGTPSARAVTLPAGRAVRTHLRAGVVVKGRSVVGDVNQVAFLRNDRSIVITVTTSAANAKKTAPVIARTSKSIRLG